MGEPEFKEEVLQRLTRIETNQKNMSDQCTPCKVKVDSLEIAVARVESAAKSAHHRVDTMQITSSELKADLKEAIKEQITGIYRTVIIIGSIVSFFVGMIASLIMRFVTGYGGGHPM